MLFKRLTLHLESLKHGAAAVDEDFALKEVSWERQLCEALTLAAVNAQHHVYTACLALANRTKKVC